MTSGLHKRVIYANTINAVCVSNAHTAFLLLIDLPNAATKENNC